MELLEVLQRAVQDGTSDIFVIAGLPLTFKNNGKQVRMEQEGKLLPARTEALIRAIYEQAGRSSAVLER